MNKKIISITFLSIFISVFLLAQTGAGYLIEDDTLVKAYNKASEYTGSGGSTGKNYSSWVDVVGDDSIYNTYGIDISIDASYLYFDIYTNFPKGGDGWIKPADLFFSVYGFDYGVVLADHRDKKQGELYDLYYEIGATRPYRTSYDVFMYRSRWIYGGLYDELSLKNVPVRITGGDLLDDNVLVSWNSIGSDPNYRIDVDVPLFLYPPETETKIPIFPEDLDGLQVGVLFGTATCGNDVITGSAQPVPEPATMLLVGMGLVGLAGLGRKRFSAADRRGLNG